MAEESKSLKKKGAICALKKKPKRCKRTWKNERNKKKPEKN